MLNGTQSIGERQAELCIVLEHDECLILIDALSPCGKMTRVARELTGYRCPPGIEEELTAIKMVDVRKCPVAVDGIEELEFGIDCPKLPANTLSSLTR